MADDERITGNLLKSPFRFHRHGQSGLPFSETLPHIARHADRIAIIRSMFTEHRNHEQALRLMHTGMTVVGRPTIGAWAAYGLGTVNQNLPAYIVLPDPGGLPIEGIRNWSSGWMPPVYQGTPFRSGGMPVLDLRPSRPRPETIEEHRLRLLSQLNEAHRQTRPEELELDARIANFEVAAGVSHHVDEVPGPDTKFPPRKLTAQVFGEKTLEISRFAAVNFRGEFSCPARGGRWAIRKRWGVVLESRKTSSARLRRVRQQLPLEVTPKTALSCPAWNPAIGCRWLSVMGSRPELGMRRGRPVPRATPLARPIDETLAPSSRSKLALFFRSVPALAAIATNLRASTSGGIRRLPDFGESQK